MSGRVKFFMTYVMTSGWTSLACELAEKYHMQVPFDNHGSDLILVCDFQILNVYVFEYDSGGVLAYNPEHDDFLFGARINHSSSRRIFHPVFNYIAAQVLIDMDKLDDPNRRSEIYGKLHSAYCQLECRSVGSSKTSFLGNDLMGEGCTIHTVDSAPGLDSLHGPDLVDTLQRVETSTS
ncbi:hypothetical protein AKJ16_DCAP14168 [Drosera capensis]